MSPSTEPKSEPWIWNNGKQEQYKVCESWLGATFRAWADTFCSSTVELHGMPIWGGGFQEKVAEIYTYIFIYITYISCIQVQVNLCRDCVSVLRRQPPLLVVRWPFSSVRNSLFCSRFNAELSYTRSAPHMTLKPPISQWDACQRQVLRYFVTFLAIH